MTGFDVVAALVVLVSAVAGWVRGAVREVITLVSFGVAAIVSLLILPITAPIGRGLIDPDWAGSIAAAVVGFVLIYFGLRLAGSLMSKSAKGHASLGPVDRFLGVLVGAARALILLGAIHLVTVAALPGERTPSWLTDAAVRPLTAGAARVIQAALPSLGRGADALTPLVGSSVRKGFSGDDALPGTQSEPTSPTAAP